MGARFDFSHQLYRNRTICGGRPPIWRSGADGNRVYSADYQSALPADEPLSFPADESLRGAVATTLHCIWGYGRKLRRGHEQNSAPDLFLYDRPDFVLLHWMDRRHRCRGIGGTALPPSVQSALGIALYAMFIAILVPPARKERPVLIVVAIGAAVSCCFSYLPGLNQLSDGWVIIICGVVSSAIGAYFFPIQPKEEPEKEWKAQED